MMRYVASVRSLRLATTRGTPLCSGGVPLSAKREFLGGMFNQPPNSGDGGDKGKDNKSGVNFSPESINAATVARAKQLLEWQKKLGSSGLPMSGMFAKQAEIFEQSIKKQEEWMNRGKAPNFQQQAAPNPKTEAFRPHVASAKDKEASSSSYSNATVHSNVDLGPELEALFKELSDMRKLKNEYRDQYDQAATERDQLRTQVNTLAAKEHDIRQRLQLSEKNVMLLNSEVMDLKEQSMQLQTAKKQVLLLQQELQALKGNDTAPLLREKRELAELLKKKDDTINSLTRKVERTRRRNPLMQFSILLSKLKDAAVAAVEGQASDTVISKDLITVEDPSADQNFATLQAKYEEGLMQCWNQVSSTDSSAFELLLNNAKLFLMSAVEYATLDCFIELNASVTPEEISQVKLLFEMKGFAVVPQETDAATSGQGLLITAPSNWSTQDVLSNGSPFIFALAASQESALAKKVMAKCYPTLSPTLLGNEARVKTETHHARSSKPGGQASNVAETQITVKLLVDGMLISVSESQDTRSAYSNEQSANERLDKEKVPKFNAKLKRVRPFANQASAAVAAGLSSSWNDLITPSMLQCAKNDLDVSLVQLVKSRMSS